MDVTRAAAFVRARLGVGSTSGATVAASHIPALLLLVGLPGTGKSYLAAVVRARHPVEIVRTDEVRKALFQPPSYSPGESGVVYKTCYELVRDLLREGRHVIFDATNTTESGRRKAYRLARDVRARLLVVVTEAPPAAVLHRIAARDAGQSPAFQSDASFSIYERMAAHFEPVARPHLVVDTSGPLTPALEVIDRFLNGQPVCRWLQIPA
jgi:predicted kinase